LLFCLCDDLDVDYNTLTLAVQYVTKGQTLKNGYKPSLFSYADESWAGLLNCSTDLAETVELFRLFTSGSKSGRHLDLDLDLVHCFMQQSGLVQRNRDCALVAFWFCVAAARHWNAEQRRGQHIQPFVSTFLLCAAECARQRICPIFSAFTIRCIYVSLFLYWHRHSQH